jgi:hypothetical protein
LKSIFGPELKVKPVRNEGGREDGKCSEYAWDCDDVCLLIMPPSWVEYISISISIVAQLLGDGLLIIKGWRQN